MYEDIPFDVFEDPDMNEDPYTYLDYELSNMDGSLPTYQIENNFTGSNSAS
jgi:hypothetical protein